MPRKQRIARRRTSRSYRMCIRKTNTLCCQFFHIRRMDRLRSVTTQVAITDIIGYQENNVRLLSLCYFSVFCLFPEQEANKVAPIPNTIVDFMIIIYLYRFMHHKHCPLSQIRIDILFGLWDRPFIVLLLTESTAVYPPSAIFVRFTTRLHTYAL